MGGLNFCHISLQRLYLRPPVVDYYALGEHCGPILLLRQLVARSLAPSDNIVQVHYLDHKVLADAHESYMLAHVNADRKDSVEPRCRCRGEELWVHLKLYK